MGKISGKDDITQLLIGLILINIATFLADGFFELILGSTGAIIVGYMIFKYLKPWLK